MWSFVVQNSYDFFLHRTRRGISLKKLSSSYESSLLLKSLLTNFNKSLNISLSIYYILFFIYLKKDAWRAYKQLTNYKEGLISNNLSKSYMYATLKMLTSNKYFTIPALIFTRLTLKELSVTKLPLTKSTFNSFLWINYLTLLNSYTSYPKHLNFPFQYTWISKEYFLDSMLNLFYYKIYKY